MWSNDIKCKYMFVFPLQNLARKELSHWYETPSDGNIITSWHTFVHIFSRCISSGGWAAVKMPASTKKDIYMARSVGELNKLADQIPKADPKG